MRNPLGAKSRFAQQIGGGVPLLQLFQVADSVHASGRDILLREDANDEALAGALGLMRQALCVHERYVDAPSYDALKHARCVVDTALTLARMKRWPEALATHSEARAMLGETPCTLAEFTTSIAPIQAEIEASCSAIHAEQAHARQEIAALPMQRAWRLRSVAGAQALKAAEAEDAAAGQTEMASDAGGKGAGGGAMETEAGGAATGAGAVEGGAGEMEMGVAEREVLVGEERHAAESQGATADEMEPPSSAKVREQSNGSPPYVYRPRVHVNTTEPTPLYAHPRRGGGLRVE